jgi:beta-lactamase superfamily II metal-dependent hydrolase
MSMSAMVAALSQQANRGLRSPDWHTTSRGESLISANREGGWVPDYYEIDFHPVHTSKSGDAITMRYQIGPYWSVGVVDGGYASTAPDVSNHIKKVYGTTRINHMLVTHPDQDHAEGLAPILEEFTVEQLWMLGPWAFARELIPYFARYESVQNLIDRLRKEYSYIAKLEEIATRRGIPIFNPLQGQRVGPFTVLAPSLSRYLQLIVASEKTPQPSAGLEGILAGLLKTVAPIVRYIKSGWGAEKFSDEHTSNENEMSVIQYAMLNGDKIVLTGDAGRGALIEAADYAPAAGLLLPGVDRFQVPHHGGRRNVSTALLDRWLGPRLHRILPNGSEKFIAMISAAQEDTDHPRKAVLRAMRHRGALVGTTENGVLWIYHHAPARNWAPLRNGAYPDEQEE